MKSILSIGCSWTYGFGLPPENTYSAYLQDLLDIEVINAGSPGVDIEYCIWATYRLIKEYEISVVLFQLTTLDRLTLAENGKGNFLDKKYHDGKVQEIYYQDCKYKRIIGIGENNLQRLTVGSYLESLNQKDEKNLTFKYLNENYVHSNLKQEKISMQLKLLESFLEQRNINIFFYSWLPWHKEFKNTLDPVSIRNDSVIECLGDNYFIDKGYHVNSSGHKKIAEDYILPMLNLK